MIDRPDQEKPNIAPPPGPAASSEQNHRWLILLVLLLIVLLVGPYFGVHVITSRPEEPSAATTSIAPRRRTSTFSDPLQKSAPNRALEDHDLEDLLDR